MQSVRSLAVLFGAIVVAWGSVASAQTQNNPIPGIDVVVKKQPAGVLIARGQTDAKGEIVLKDLPAGDYAVALSGKGLDEALKQKGATGAVTIQTVGASKPEGSPTKRVGNGMEGEIKVTDQDARAKTLRVRVSADVSTLRVQNYKYSGTQFNGSFSGRSIADPSATSASSSAMSPNSAGPTLLRTTPAPLGAIASTTCPTSSPAAANRARRISSTSVRMFWISRIFVSLMLPQR